MLVLLLRNVILMHVSLLVTFYSSFLHLFDSKSFFMRFVKNFRKGKWTTTPMEKCRGYNPRYTKVPLCYTNIYIIYQVICARILKKQVSSSLGQNRPSQARLTKPRPTYSEAGPA
jgi:hypothetical protein